MKESVRTVIAFALWLTALFSFTSAGYAAFPSPLGTQVGSIARQVKEMVRDPIRPRIYATTAINTVIAIDTSTLSIVGEIAIGSNPNGLDVSQDGAYLYVANSGSTTSGIGVVNLATFQALPSLSTPFQPTSVAAGLNGHLYITSGSQLSSLTQIDSTTGAVQATVSSQSVSVYSGKLRISPDRKTLYYFNFGLSPSTLYSLNVSGSTPVLLQTNNFAGSNGEDLEVSDDGSALVAPSGGGSGGYGYTIALIPSTNINGSLGAFNTGAYPVCGAFSPDGTTFYTSPDSQNSLQIYSTSTFQQSGSFQAPDMSRLLVDRTGRYLFAATSANSPSNSGFTSAGLTVYSTGSGTYPAVNSAGSLTIHENDSVNFQLTATENNVTWAAKGLPAGLSLNSATGIISGSVSTPGSYTVQLTVTDQDGGQGKSNLSISVLTLFTVQISGQGTLSNGYPGAQWLPLGTSFSITATPAATYVFGGWSGSKTTSNGTVTGTVAADMVLTATFLPTSTLTVTTSGPGAVSSSLAGSTVHLTGANITVTAIPNFGARFIGWTGDIVTTQQTLSFALNQPTNLIANFESLTPYAGSYVFGAANTAAGPRSALSMTLGSAGSFTGKLLYAGKSYNFYGDFHSLSGFSTQFVTSTGQTISLQINVSLVNGEPLISGTVNGFAGQMALTGYRLATIIPKVAAASQAGKYTFYFTPPGTGSATYGYGTATVSKAGAVTFAGVLGDGTAFLAGAKMTDTGDVLVSIPLYAGTGFLEGWLQFRDQPNLSDFDGNLMWSQPAKVGKKVVANATIANMAAAGSLFAPVAGTNILPFTSGAITCSGGGLATALNDSVTLRLLNHIVPLSPNANSLISALNAKTGAFSGSFIPTGAKARVPFKGVVYTKNPMAIGQFKGTTGRGLVELAP